MSKLHLAIGIPAYGGQITAHQARMWLEFGNTLGGSTERFNLVACDFYDVNGIDQARNLMLARAVELNADWLLMIDADTWVEPSALDRQAQSDAGFLLLRMISDADRRNAAAVAAPVVRRRLAPSEAPNILAPREQLTLLEVMGGERGAAQPAIDPTVMLYQATITNTLEDLSGMPFDEFVAPHETVTYHPLELAGLKGLVDVDAAATAVFAVNVPRAVQAKATFAFRNGRSEDLEFCHQLRAAGMPILADLRVRTGHLSRTAPLFSTP